MLQEIAGLDTKTVRGILAENFENKQGYAPSVSHLLTPDQNH
jgi:hypothetical protein